MELVFHIYMKLGIKYIPIYLFFSIAGGLVCVLLTSFFPETVNRIIGCVLTGFLGFIFCVEIICKTVLAQYYQIASSLSMAMNNKLGDYRGNIQRYFYEYFRASADVCSPDSSFDSIEKTY